MKKGLLRLAALGLCAAVLASPALALTTEQLGDILRQRYVGNIPDRVWQETTVEGMLEALGDPNTRYFTGAEFDAFKAGMDESGQEGPTASVTAEGTVGVIDIRAFGAGTYDVIRAGLEAHPEVEQWVVDLRHNTGGELRAVADVTALFMDGGPLAYIGYKSGELSQVTSERKTLVTGPVVVLVGSETASGGELMAADLRDGRRGLVIGGRTRGVGTGQTVLDGEKLPQVFDDGSVLKLTTRKLYTMCAYTVDRAGVLPHLAVEDGVVEGAARLLRGTAPDGNGDWLRLEVGRQLWYVRRQDAQAAPAAFAALLEALSSGARLYMGQGDGVWSAPVSAAEAAAAWGVSYTAQGFSDVGASPYRDVINDLKLWGIVRGGGDGTYKPGDTLNRASVCSLLAQAMGYPRTPGASRFSDVPEDHWGKEYINTLADMGIVKGKGEDRFDPDGTITHQEFMTILARIAGNTSFECAAAMAVGPQEGLGDYESYDSWARMAAWALDGCWYRPAADIDPRADILRGEAAQDLYGMLYVAGVLPE